MHLPALGRQCERLLSEEAGLIHTGIQIGFLSFVKRCFETTVGGEAEDVRCRHLALNIAVFGGLPSAMMARQLCGTTDDLTLVNFSNLGGQACTSIETGHTMLISFLTPA